MGTKTIKVVLDANTYVSFFLTRSETLSAIFSFWKAGAFTMYTSSEMIAETYRVFQYPKLQKRMIDADRWALRELLEVYTERVLIVGDVRFPKDQDDAIYLETVQACGADYLVSGDSDLLSLKMFGKTQIVSPKEFVEVLRKGI